MTDRKKLPILVLTVTLILLMMSSSIFSSSAAAGEITSEVEQVKEINSHYFKIGMKIGIFYDLNNELAKETGESLVNSLSLMSPNIIGIPISSLTQLEDNLAFQELSFGIYVFPSTHASWIITSKRSETKYSWTKIADILDDHKDMHHIFAMGNTKQLFESVNDVSNIYGTGEERVDSQQMFIYALWTLADILEENFEGSARNFAEDIRRATLQYFADNFNSITARTVEPEDPMGVEHPDTILAREQAFYDKYPAKVERIPRPGYVVDPETQRDADPETGEIVAHDYVMDIFPKTSAMPTDFILQLLPKDSGLRGPIGGIVDELLGLLFDYIGGAIGLSQGTVEGIANAIMAIPDFIGAVKDPSSSSMKGFLNKIKPMLPIPQDMMNYFDLIVDALFLLRGDANDITGFIKTAIDLIVPDIELGGIKLSTIIGQIFDLGENVFTKISEGGNAMDIILSVLNEQILANLTSIFIGNETSNAFSLGASQITELGGLVSSTLGMIVNFISTGSVKDLIKEYGPELLNLAFDHFGQSLDPVASKVLMHATSLLLIATGIVEGENLQDTLVEMLKELSPVDVDTIVQKAEEIIGAISDALDDVFTVSGLSVDDQVSDFKTKIKNIVSALNLGSDIEDAIEDIATIIVALQSASFSLDSGTSITSLVTSMLAKYGVINSDWVETVDNLISTLYAIIAFIKNPPNLKDMLSKLLNNLFSGVGDLKSVISKIIKSLINLINPSMFPNLTQLNSGIQVDTVADDLVNTASEAISLIFQIITKSGENAVEGLLLTLLQGGTYILSQVMDTDLSALVEVMKGIFGKVIGLVDSPPSTDDLISAFMQLQASNPLVDHDTISTIIGFVTTIRDVFTDGFRTIFAKLSEWLAGQITDLIGSLTGKIGGVLGSESWDLFDIDIPIGIGSFSLFTISIKLGLSPGFEFDAEKFTGMIFDLVFKGVSIFKDGADFGEILKTALSFFSIIPIFEAGFELKGFDSKSSPFLSFMLEALGLEVSFSGYGFFKLMLFSFQNGVFNWDNFFKVIEWGFGFKITISKTMTILDFLTGGAGGGLNAIGKYIGLDAISITIAFSLGFDIVKRAAIANQPETGTMTITFAIGFTVSLGIDLFIAELRLSGALEIILTLLQDLVTPTPLRVFISIELIITVTIGFLFWDWDFDFHWSPGGFSPPLGYELTSPSPEAAVGDGAMGGDTDKDGLSDEYEKNTPGLNYQSVDSDGDTLDDKFETQTLKSDPARKDTDQDGLDDNIEFNLKTNLLNPDTDFDGLNDYEESVILGTDPMNPDSDFDGLDDYYEVNHVWNMTGITPSVSGIMIGGVPYDDRTDPLNPDTDGDGLIDGEEGERGIFYGPELYDYDKNNDDPDAEPMGYTPDDPFIVNGGYTHPLDNDTDDDSYWQSYDGSIAPVEIPFIMDMTDYTETHGISVIFYDPETGEPEPARIVRTNPTNPDSDGDTGITPEQKENPPFGFFINSDGYELSRDPPTDPLDGDTDDDGLIDGLEGMLRPDSNHTHAVNPDTDGDGLGDMQELELGTDGRSVDTDLDGVSDGDEFFIFGTNPFLADTDSDGLEDGEELWLYHSNPFSRDSDRDGLSDYDEVWIYFSSPADEDSDNDGLDDFEEIKIYYTDPFDEDTDDDGLFDGEEINGLTYTINGTDYLVFTDPTKWDTDDDSLTTLDQYGEMSMPMSDFDEWKLGTDPTRRDTDLDGILDGWEMWLGKGVIPNFDPIILNPLSNDTDGDGLYDGAEMHVGNVTTLLNPYIGFVLITPFNTSAANNDTDGDFLDDLFEIKIGTNPAFNDTDHDTLSDYRELTVLPYTDPIKNDTDGDGLLDHWEINGIDPLNLSLGLDYDPTRVIKYPDIHPNNSDSDGDLLPDGAEIFRYGKDPTNDDENNNGILDGMEIDSDGDGLWDGEEYYVYGTVSSPYGGGAFEPDSDRDGLFDGLEVYELGTDPVLWDTDNDTYSDGLEYYCGTNALDNSTSESEMQDCFGTLERIAILSPAAKTYKTNAIPVIVFSDVPVVDMEYRYKREQDSTWSIGVPMVEGDPAPNYWKGTYLGLPLENATFNLEVTAEKEDASITTRLVTFTLHIDAGGLRIDSPKEQTYSFQDWEDTNLPIVVQAGIDYNDTWFRIKNDDGSILKDNTTLVKENDGKYHSDYTFPDDAGKKTYYIEVFGQKTNGEILVTANAFNIKTPTIEEYVAVGGMVVGGIAAITVMAKVVRPKFKSPFKKQV